MKKYELTEETLKINENQTLYRIRAIKDFADVKAGDLGGFVESENNLSHNGDCWISGDSKVFGFAWICGSARIFGSAIIYGSANISGTATISDFARLSGSAEVF